jgi:hypothetical protein
MQVPPATLVPFGLVDERLGRAGRAFCHDGWRGERSVERWKGVSPCQETTGTAAAGNNPSAKTQQLAETHLGPSPLGSGENLTPITTNDLRPPPRSQSFLGKAIHPSTFPPTSHCWVLADGLLVDAPWTPGRVGAVVGLRVLIQGYREGE